MATVLAFPADRVVELEPAEWERQAKELHRRERARIRHECTAGAEVDAILRTPLEKVPRMGKPGWGAERSRAIREVFRALGWSRYFRVTKGGYSLGTSIEWAKGTKPAWRCDRSRRARELDYNAPWCFCETCKYRQAQREAVMRRVHHVLNLAFVTPGEREFGNRSDTQSDYFDADYTFHA